MIIELRKYIEIGELLIEKGSTGSQAQVIYQDGDRRVSVTRVAVCMEEKGTGMQTGYRGAYNKSPSREWEQVHIGTLWSNQRSISTQ